MRNDMNTTECWAHIERLRDQQQARSNVYDLYTGLPLRVDMLLRGHRVLEK